MRFFHCFVVCFKALSCVHLKSSLICNAFFLSLLFFSYSFGPIQKAFGEENFNKEVASYTVNTHSLSTLASLTTTSTDSHPLWSLYARDILHTIAGDDTSAFFGFTPTIEIVSNPLPHAYVTRDGKLTFSSGILSLVRSRSEYAFLLAHELAHEMLGHTKHLAGGSHSEDLVDREITADSLAMDLLEEAGFEKEAGINLLKKLGDYGQEYGVRLGASRPSLSHRHSALQKLLANSKVRILSDKNI